MVIPPRRRGARQGDLREMGASISPSSGAVTDSRRLVLKAGGAMVGDLPIRPLVDDAPLYERPYRLTSPAPIAGAGSARERGAGADRGALPAHRHAGPSARSGWILGAIRPHGDGRHGAAPWRRCRRGAGPRHRQGAGADHRLHAALLRRRSGVGRGAGGRGGLAHPHRGRRAAARAHRLPQFRQSPSEPASWASSSVVLREWRRPAGRSISRSSPAMSPSTTRPTAPGILPTPTIGGVGLIADLDRMCDLALKAPGERLLLLGAAGSHLGRSLYQREIGGRDGRPAAGGRSRR